MLTALAQGQELPQGDLARSENGVLNFKFEKVTNLYPETYQLCTCVTLFKAPLTPRPPLRFEHWVDFFSMDWEALCTALRLDNIRRRSEENIPFNLNNSIIKKSFGVNFKYFYANLM